MNNPNGVYGFRRIIFDQNISTTQNIILIQGADALLATIRLIENVRKLVDESPLKNAYISPDIPFTLSNLCYQAGLASTILFNGSAKGYKESKLSFKLRIERVNYVNHLCKTQGLETPTLKSRSIRNALTHIDEYLADALTAEPNVAWFIDTAIESRDQFEPISGLKTKFCRAYIKDEDKIIHLDKEVSLLSLQEECTALLAVVFGQSVSKVSQ